MHLLYLHLLLKIFIYTKLWRIIFAFNYEKTVYKHNMLVLYLNLNVDLNLE